ncbi:MAG: protealysin inhibitor emfourin [Thermoleophilaceae bacterium]
MAEAGPFSISFRRSGGILPGQVLETSLEEAELGAAETVRLRELVDDSDLPTLAARSPITGRGADVYQYELAVEGHGQQHRVVVAGSAVPAELRPLIQMLELRAQRAPVRRA